MMRCSGKFLVMEPYQKSENLIFEHRVNVKPIYLSTKVIVPYWKGKGAEGLFINMSSISEPRPRPFVVWYAASKSAEKTAAGKELTTSHR